jgi:hypothetical protein
MGDAASMPAELAAVRNARRLMLGSFMERGWLGCGGTLLTGSHRTYVTKKLIYTPLKLRNLLR